MGERKLLIAIAIANVVTAIALVALVALQVARPSAHVATESERLGAANACAGNPDVHGGPFGDEMMNCIETSLALTH